MTVSWLPQRISCITPLGPATALGCDFDKEAQEWVTIIDRTGENFNWQPEDIRFPGCVTDRRMDVSPFGRPSPVLQRQIERYQANGWL